ncbi:MAG: hypothetical protein ACE37B_11205 [Ilumatobacter sp.]|uniref:hypothetical protein n=1 Tax=Ilumatobacter sp. TaxID=1967498 RepID=UPI00391AF3F8
MTKKLSALLGVAYLLASACSGSSSSEPEVTAPVPTSAATYPTTPESTAQSEPVDSENPNATAATTDPATTSSSSSIPPSTTEDPSPADDLGPRLDSVPGVESPGEIIELVDMVALFIPSEADPADANVAPPLPEDLEIIEAYARAMKALYGQVTQNPIPIEPSEAMAASFLDGGATYSDNVFAPRNEAGQHLAFQGDNDVLRPIVLADPRSDDEAFIFDCAISGSNYVNTDGSLADGETPGSETAPLIIRLVRVDGGWIVTDIQDDERACR